jgi:putative methanogenesis marker protein 8
LAEKHDEHVVEALGRARVVIKNGTVTEVGEPLIGYCPLFDKHRGIKQINKQVIADNIQFRIKDFGMCTKDRVLEMRDFLSFGISEIMMTALREKKMDAAVIVCEGCGTVVLTKPEMVQGIGGRVSGLVSTTPIPELIERVGPENVLDPKTAKIDMVAGVKKAIDMGFKKIGVSIISGKDAKHFREMEKQYGVTIYTFIVHTTGLTKQEAKDAFQYADVLTGCASKYIREQGMESGAFRVGDSIPIFGATQRGQMLIEERIKAMGKPIVAKPDAKQPDKLI